MSTSIEELMRWMTAPREDEHLEFKEARTQLDNTKLFRYCVALANEGGGKLVLGVTDKPPRRVVGSAASRSPAGMAQKILGKLGFRVDVEALSHPDGRVVIFHVPPRPRGTAYSLDGAYWMRSGEDLVPMSEDQLRRIFNEGKPDWTTETAADGCSAADVVQLLDTQSYFDLMKLPYPADRAGVLDRLERDKLLTHDHGEWSVTNLGAILFAKRLDEFDLLVRKAPRVIVSEGTGKLKTKLDQVVGKGYAVGFEGLVDFINAQVPRNEVIVKALREEVKMFPEIAVRELVANALIHQDFSEVGRSVMVELYSDRLEVSNPGKPFIPPDRFIDEYQSRNERLADVMRRIGICEEKGSGIDKVITAAEVYQLPAPDFRVGERTTAVLFAHEDFKKMDRADRIRACYQHCCLRYVTNERMTNQSLRERFGLPPERSTTASQVIRATIDADLIKTEGDKAARKTVRYAPYWA
jgi:ATP-dependent DNA helicase RecG